jgi:N-methylhydantoinase A/oxoprolinase/acetone carboxylase beta subunit
MQRHILNIPTMKNLTEVSKSLVKAYMKKAYNSMADTTEKAPTQDAGRSSTEHFKNRETIERRKTGLKIAGEKMMGKAKVKLSEALLNEISDKKVAEYEDAARDSSEKAANTQWRYFGKNNKSTRKADETLRKRAAGADLVWNREVRKSVNEGEQNRHDTSKPTLRRLTPVEILNKKLGRERAQNQQVRTQINEVLGFYLKD